MLANYQENYEERGTLIADSESADSTMEIEGADSLNDSSAGADSCDDSEGDAM